MKTITKRLNALCGVEKPTAANVMRAPAKINGYTLHPETPIHQGDLIVRRSTGEVGEANDEWCGDLHHDWVKATKQI